MSSSKFKINNKELLRALGIAQTTRGHHHGSFMSQHSFFQESESGFEMTKHFDNSISYNVEDENQEDKEDRGEFLFSLDIDITDDTKDFLAVYTKDKPYELARSFCDKHGIEPEIADVIAARIVENAKQTLINRETLMMNCQAAVSDSDETNEEERVTYDENQMLPKGGDDSVDDVYSPTIRGENYKSKIMSEKDMNFESAAKTVFTTEIKEVKPYEVLTSGADEGISRFIGSTKDTRKSSSFAQGFTEENASPMKSQQSKRTSRDKFYEKTLRDIENRVRKDAIIMEIHNEEKYKECTFHPNLNPISLKLAGNRKRDVSTEDILLLKGKIADEKRAMRKQTARSKENRNNTFRPELNDMSKCLEEKNRPNYNQKERFEDLYQEYKVLREKRNQLKAQMIIEYPFAPNTCNTKRADKDGPNFLERLAEDIEQRKIKKTSEEEEQQESLPTFCPKILKNVSNGSRNLEKLPVGEYLYRMATDIENKKTELREEFDKELRAKAPKCSEKSAQITQARIKKNLQHIFEALDTDKDGLISTDQITLETIPKDLSIMLEPIFNGLKALNCQQNVNQFLETCLELLKAVDPIIKSFWALDFSKKQPKDRNELMQEREQEIGMVFHPKIDQKSKQMVGNEDQRQGRSVHQRLYAEKTRSEVRLKELKERKDKEELRECSFHPVINNYPGGTETYYQKVFAGLDTSI